MEWLPPQGRPSTTDRSRPTTGSPSRSSSISVVRDVVGQEGGSIRGSLFEGAQTSTGNEASSFRHGGKRPRSTSSIFAAAATGMLTGRVVPTAEVAVPSFSTQQQAVHHDRQPNTLLRLRGQPRMRSGRVGVSNASGCVARAGKERVVLGDPVAAIAAASATATAVFRSNAAGAMILDESSNREDTLGEAAAMAADERRSSPPARLHEHSVGYHLEHDGKRKPKPSQSTVTDGNPEGRWSRGIPFSSGTHNDSHGCLTEGEAVASSSFLDVHHRRSSSPPAPAYEPSLLNEDNNTAEGLWRYNPDGHLKETARRSPEETQQQRYGSAGAQKIDGDVELAIGASSWANKTASPQHQEAESNARVEVEDDGETHAQTSQQRVSAVSTLEGGRPPSPTVDRQDFLSTIKKSDDAYHSVREDLLHYMKGVRARTSEDGTPSVAFPRNFDRIVGLMGRHDLEDQSPDEEAKDDNRSSGSRRSPHDSAKDDGKGKGKGAGQGDRLPPWTKYLLEEGIDRTEAFSRYRGMLADEQTGEDRVMRGLAKMRELDLRLARTTERARELKTMARHAAEQAERAAASVTAENKGTSSRHHEGRGPVAVEDVTNNHPRLRLPLPLSSEPAPFGAISSRVSNGSARQMDSDGGGGTGSRTERSEMSAASGSQPRADGPGSSSRDGQARGGRVFVTQTFRGAGRKGSSSNTGSASASVDGSENLTSTSTPVCRGKSKFGSAEDGASRDGASSTYRDGRCKSGSRGGCSGSGQSSGVSFVLKNKRNAARVSRRRLTDEQESLVSRFLRDTDGFNDEGEPTGEQPSGVWAEIAPYGGAGASDAAARLAEINAKILEIGGTVLRDFDEEPEEGNTVQESEQRLPSSTAAASEQTGIQGGDQGRLSSPSRPPPPPPPSRSREIAAPATAAKDAAAPGEAALREQRERREARYRERAIDNALEQLRDSLFQNLASGSGKLREEVVDTALEQARAAPLDMQGGIRPGAGRIGSLLGGDGPQPVGEWEVKHALRRGEEELRGKELASQDKIEELLITVRQKSAAGSAGLLPRIDDVVSADDFPPGTTLDAVFSVTGAARSDAEDGPADILCARSDSSLSDAASGGSPSSPSAGRREGMDAAETARKLQRQADGNMLGSTAPMNRGSRLTETRARSSRRKGKKANETATSTTAGAAHPIPALHPRPRLPLKKQPHSVVPPELTALFRAPLLVPRHLNTSVAGIAAAAVAAGGASRIKPGTGVASSDI